MSSQRQQAYLNLITKFLNCATGKEAEILATHWELADDGLLAAVRKKANHFRKKGKLNNANRLKKLAGGLREFLPVLEAHRLLKQGNSQSQISQSREALQSYEEALTIYRKIENRAGELCSLRGLGDAYQLLEQYHRAICFHEQSLEISREIGYSDEESAALCNLGIAYNYLGQYDRAIYFLEQSNETNKLSIPKIQQIARDRNSTIVEYSIIDPEIYIWVIQPNGNITHRAANLEPLNQQNQSLKQIILQTRVSIGTVETDDEGNKIQLESQYNRDETGRFPLLQLLHQILIEPIIDLLPADANSPIIFVPHYDLFLVPFAALQDSNNRYLIEHHTILTSPSIQVLELTREHQNRVKKAPAVETAATQTMSASADEEGIRR